MSVLREFGSWPAGPLHVAIGIFDGVHVGHRALIAHLARGARAAGARAIAVTFDPLPIQVLAPGAPPFALSAPLERAGLLHEAGADDVALVTFDLDIAALPPERFIDLLVSAGSVKQVIVGDDFRFGRDRTGDTTLLRRLGARAGFAVDIPTVVSDANGVVSSTRVRNALRSGDVAEAARLLGRLYSVTGRVIRGEQRGRGLGYPTINLETPMERLLPRDGIYAMWVELDGARHRAAASLGVRPTFGGGPRRLEAFLLDFSGEIYGLEVRASFARRLRDELHFEGPAALADQIARDVEEVRATLREARKGLPDA